MKKVTFLFLVLIVLKVNAQIESITFNVSTDLTRNFSNTSWISYSPSNGINNSGALLTPNITSWGNDVIKFKKYYSNSTVDTLKAQISFKYNSTNINPNDYQRAAAIFLNGTDNNHDISFYLNKDKTLSVTSYSYAQNSQLTMQDNHWYILEGILITKGGQFGDEIYAVARVFDIGLNGLSNPTLVGSHKAKIFDINLVNESRFEVSVCGAKWGGAEYLDNFGVSGNANCLKESFLTKTIYQNQCYSFNGQTICAPGEYSQTIKQNGCDSIVHLTLYKSYIDTIHIKVTDTLIINANLTSYTPILYANTIKVYPNPTKDAINIDYGSNYSTLNGYTIKIVNSLGQSVYTSLINKKTETLDLKTWTGKGIYFVHFIDVNNNTLDIKKIIIQ